MNLHVFSDSLGYYSNETVSRIEELQPKENLYINVYDDVKYRHRAVDYFNFTRKECDKKLSLLPQVNNVFFHFFTMESTHILKWLKKRNPDVTSVWVIWSADLYCSTKIVDNLCEAFSSKFANERSFLRRVYDKAIHLLEGYSGKMIYSQQVFLRSLKKVDYIACLLNHEYLFAKEKLHLQAPHIPFAYLSYEQLIPKEVLHKTTSGTKIMVNHSAVPHLNHFEVLELLHKNKVANPIYIPLAYGSVRYRVQISSVARQMFGDQVEIQEDFVAKYDYARKLADVGFAIFNVKIQQGLGNIISLLWLGVKLFLREENPVFQDFKEWGLHVYSVQKDLPTERFDRPLCSEQIAHNRTILAAQLSNEKVVDYYRNLIGVKSI